MTSQFAFALAFTLFFCLLSMATYSYAKKVFPNKMPWLPLGGLAASVLIAFLVNAPLSFLLFFTQFIYCFYYYRKQNQKAIRQFFSDFGIYQATNVPPTVLKALGERKWTCASGSIFGKTGKEIRFNWWQGQTSYTVSSGSRSSTSVIFHLAISFPPAITSNSLRTAANALKNQRRPFLQRLKDFFVRSKTVPFIVAETPDQQLVVAWNIEPTAHAYAEKLKWIREYGV